MNNHTKPEEDKPMPVIAEISLIVAAGFCIFVLAPAIISRRNRAGRAVCPKCSRPAECFLNREKGAYRISCACGYREEAASISDRCPFCRRKHRD